MRGWRELLLDQAAAFFVLATPLLNFLRHNGYPFWRAEVGLLALVVVLVAGLLGWVMNRTGQPGRAVVLVALMTLVVDVQTRWITTLGLRLLLVVVALSLVAWIFRRHLTRTVALVFGLMFLATLLVPGQPLIRQRGGVWGPDDPDLPFILHIVLDEHIGIEGIPREFDSEGELAAELSESLLADGFQVYGRAYSRYYQTFESLPNLLNFRADQRQSAYFPGGFREGAALAENAWFQQQAGRGYRIEVVDSDYIRFGPPDLQTGGFTYSAENPAILDGLPLSAVTKVRQIAGEYARLSYLLPEKGLAARHISLLAAMGAVDRLEADLRGLKHGGRGRMVFAHILMPHSPYGLDAGCGLRPALQEWLSWRDHDLAPRHNTPETRAERYPLYLDQLRCTQLRLQEIFAVLKEQGMWDDAIIIVHGDHGSRLDLGPPKNGWEQEMSPDDFRDAFSTLFAVKLPGQPAVYDDEQLPIDYLFAALFREGGAAEGPPVEPEVYCYTRGDSLRVWPMAVFGGGEAAGPPNSPSR